RLTERFGGNRSARRGPALTPPNRERNARRPRHSRNHPAAAAFVRSLPWQLHETERVAGIDEILADRRRASSRQRPICAPPRLPVPHFRANASAPLRPHSAAAE